VDFVFLSPNRGLPFFSLSPVSQIPICLKFALGDLALGVLPELDLTKWTATADENEFLVNSMKIEFYFSAAIRAKRDTDTAKCQEYMRACTNCSPVYGTDIPEWHLARYEVAKLIASGE
jgi:hypothetical protein